MRKDSKRPRPKIILLQATVLAGIGLFAMSVPFAKPAVAELGKAVNEEAQEQKTFEERNTPPKAVLDRTATIEAELKQPRTQPWAGAYYEGDGLGANILMLVSPRSGVAVTWHGCLGLYGANEGSIQPESDGSLRLAYNLSNNDKFGGFPDRVLPVQWGVRHYLIPPGRLLDFVNDINQGFEPRPRAWGRFLLVDGDELKPVHGLPTLPPGYAERIRNAAAEAKVVSASVLSEKSMGVDGMCERTYRFNLSVSGAGPLQKGDELKLVAPENAFETLRITDSRSSHTIGEATIIESDCSKPDVVPDRHWRFSTGAYDATAANRRIEEAKAEQAVRR